MSHGQALFLDSSPTPASSLPQHWGKKQLERSHCLMTSPSADRDLLMCCASRSRLPSAPDRPTRSEPARSTRFSFPEDTQPNPRAGISAQPCTAPGCHSPGASVRVCCVTPTCGAEPRAAVEAADVTPSPPKTALQFTAPLLPPSCARHPHLPIPC
uniref:Uncharacterized protein n=1 Tax=Zosterops lateralis melanops TaxID=1220523 RepID=A0A8D2NLX9_ZOSLA